MPETLPIRRANSADTPALRALYGASVRATAAPFYSAAQVAAWAGFADDARAFGAWLGDARTWVAERAVREIVGFVGLATGPAPGHGYVTALYVAPGAMRRGLGTRLLGTVLEAAARDDLVVLTAHASALSRPLFERAGFDLAATEHSRHGGVDFVRWLMRRGG